MTDPQHVTPHVTLYHGNNLHILPTMPDASIDSIVTDPPYELGFMGKSWDASGIAYNVDFWAECLRVLKPGGHLLAFGGTRTYHRMAVAIEDAGFEIRDSLHWVYGSGFPKSLNVSKAIDKAAGAERKAIKSRRSGIASGHTTFGDDNWKGIGQSHYEVTAPATDAAKQWDGWGTALKPAHEPIVLARKPLVGTVAANVLEHGTGALNIDATRVAYQSDADKQGASGRWPANIIFDEEAGAELDAQSGIVKDGGGASRFFYCPKPSKRERNAGLDGLPKRRKSQLGSDKESRDGLDPVSARFVSADPVANTHPTVKPLALMQWLIRLVTPPNGTVLDPFAGSGTTLAAATLENINSIGIELTDDYLPIITARCQWAETQHNNQPETEPTLFDNHD